MHDEGLIYAGEGGKLICLHKDFDGRVTGATAIDPTLDRHQGDLIAGSSRTGSFYYFEDNPQVTAQRVVITDSPIESMAYSVVHDADCPTLYLAAHEGGWVPGDRLENIPMIIATDMELVNLLPRTQRHTPTGKSWVDDLQALTDLVVPELPDAEIFAQVERQRLEREAPIKTKKRLDLEH